MDKEYRIDVKVRNNVILYKIEQAGYETVGEFCRLNNMMKYTSQLGSIISMTKSPLQSNGEFRKCIIHIADLLGCDPLDLFTDTQLRTILKTNKRNIQVNEAEMKFMLDSQNQHKLLEEIVEEKQLSNEIEKQLDRLTVNEKKVLQMRMGLMDGKEYTLEDCGLAINCSRDRARQLEARALRKLRHPNQSKSLREFVQNAD